MDRQRCLKNNIWHDWYRECHVRSQCWGIWGPCCGCQVLSSKEAPNGEEADKTTGGGLLGRVSKLTFHDFMTPHCWRCQIHPNSIFTTNFVYHLYNRWILEPPKHWKPEWVEHCDSWEEVTHEYTGCRAWKGSHLYRCLPSCTADL